ncbi:MAG: family 20 glycosylhydrolase [Candidatus Sumerlaeaceae bacterium]
MPVIAALSIGWLTTRGPVFLIAVVMLAGGVAPGSSMLPIVKEAELMSSTVSASRVAIRASHELSAEAEVLRGVLMECRISQTTGVLPITLELDNSLPDPSVANTPEAVSRWRAEGYRLSVRADGISVAARNPPGVFYGIQTLSHILVDRGTSVPVCEVVDWPDLPLRMVMVDPARQNESFDYYRRLIRFCARQKINAMLLHLTDDQTAALFEPNYPELMHKYAWTSKQARALADYARKYHVELIPEIESCGHSRMFTRRKDYPEYLHQTTKARKPSDWMGTDMPGYTNVLCPASEKGYEYIERMVAAAQVFDSPVVHLGFDEVDMTTCAQCMANWPGKPPEYWFAHQLERNLKIVEKHGKRAAVWGDMLLKHPEMLEKIEPSRLIIYDWHYHPEVTAETPRFFTSRGFEVVACPSLMCSPHIIVPDEMNYNNVRTFAKVARDEKLAGLNTTFWLPTRYLSGAMFPAFAYAGAQAWSGSNFDKQQCLGAFACEYFGIRDAAVFTDMWDQLGTATLHLRDFETACYFDEAGASAATKLFRSKGKALADKSEALKGAIGKIDSLDAGVKRNPVDWETLRHSAGIISFALDRAATAADSNSSETASLVRSRAKEALNWIQKDWDRNRYPGDPNLKGMYLPGQNLAWRFKQMSER